jgi:putative oxidoreductase
MTVPPFVQKVRELLLGILAKLEFAPALLTRLIVGFAFYDSGSGKLQNIDNVVGFFETLGIPFPDLNAHFVARLEYYGGMLLIAGVVTRFIAALLSSTMVVAILTADRESFMNALLRRAGEDGASGIGLSDVAPFVLLVFLLWLVVRGAGLVSVDAIAARTLLTPSQGGSPRKDRA